MEIYYFGLWFGLSHWRVVINGQTSEWGDVLAGVPQGAVPGPLVFLYIYDLSFEVTHCNIRFFADDIYVFS